MSTDPLSRLLPAFGDVLVRYRAQRNWTVEALATAAGLSVVEVSSMECGDYGPTLPEFFRVASALDEQPTTLLVDVTAAWRADRTDLPNTSRSSDFTRLFRLGYHLKPGDFRELSPSYYSIPEATHAAGKLNAQRHSRGMALLDTVCVYVRLDYVALRADVEEVTP